MDLGEALKGADLVNESVTEDVTIKKALWTQVGQLADPKTWSMASCFHKIFPVFPSKARIPISVFSNSFFPAPITISKTPSLVRSTVRGEDIDPITGKSFVQTTALFFLFEWAHAEKITNHTIVSATKEK